MNECHFGLTPGGCTDHPQVWERMSAFLKTVVTRYRDQPNLRGWDCWNETRWNVDAEGIVCHCPHTLAAFRQWLGRLYGDLDGLAEERLAAMRVTGKVVEQHRSLLDAYQPAPATVGVLFSPQTYYLQFSQTAGLLARPGKGAHAVPGKGRHGGV